MHSIKWGEKKIASRSVYNVKFEFCNIDNIKRITCDPRFTRRKELFSLSVCGIAFKSIKNVYFVHILQTDECKENRKRNVK